MKGAYLRTGPTYAADFETTVFEGQTTTEVWAAALIDLAAEDEYKNVMIYHSLDDMIHHLIDKNENATLYFHNLKFDGEFIVDWLLRHGYKTALYTDENGVEQFFDNEYMPLRSFKSLISDKRIWYTVTVRLPNRKYLSIKDSLKLLPFNLRKIGKDFDTMHKKLDMEYQGERYAGCEITDDEAMYIANDVLVLKEALNYIFKIGIDKLTIGASCLAEFNKRFGDKKIRELVFPDLNEYIIDKKAYGSTTAWEYVVRSYKGGWCYVVPYKTHKHYENGCTADVNSLYPSMMHSSSGNYYPVGEPTFWRGNTIPKKALTDHFYYFVRVNMRFNLKPGYLPCIQIKHDARYYAREWLTTSDIVYPAYHSKTFNITCPERYSKEYVTLTLTQTDFELIKEHYDVDYTILDGCYFSSDIGIFDLYINHWYKIKQEAKGALSALAKLMLNNLYGKFAANRNSSFQIPAIKDGLCEYHTVVQFDKKPGYIPIGSAITSYARNFTIRAAQKNYHGDDKPGFIYADTDSIHCDLPGEELQGVEIHDSDMCKWKIESNWTDGWFIRAKTYAEREDNKWQIKCAGMSQRCKDLISVSFGEKDRSELKKISSMEEKFLEKTRTIADFDYGLCVPGKLIPVRLPGGVVLNETTFELMPFGRRRKQ